MYLSRNLLGLECLDTAFGVLEKLKSALDVIGMEDGELISEVGYIANIRGYATRVE